MGKLLFFNARRVFMLMKFDLDFSPGWEPRSFTGITEVRGQI